MLEKIRAFLVEQYGLKEEEITADKELSKDLGLTSFQLVEMCAELEEAFDIEIDEDELPKVITIGDLLSLIERECSCERQENGGTE